MTEVPETLEGHVIAILDHRELVIDIGYDDGVTIGMRFAVLGQETVETTDGRTFTIDYPKTIVKIVRLEGSELAVGRTFRTVPGRKGRPPLDLDKLGSFRPYLEGTPDTPPTTERLHTEGEPLLAKRDVVIRKGDAVRQTIDDEYLDTL